MFGRQYLRLFFERKNICKANAWLEDDCLRSFLAGGGVAFGNENRNL